jgi:hypothetical protein
MRWVPEQERGEAPTQEGNVPPLCNCLICQRMSIVESAVAAQVEDVQAPPSLDELREWAARGQRNYHTPVAYIQSGPGQRPQPFRPFSLFPLDPRTGEPWVSHADPCHACAIEQETGALLLPRDHGVTSREELERRVNERAEMMRPMESQMRAAASRFVDGMRSFIPTAVEALSATAADLYRTLMEIPIRRDGETPAITRHGRAVPARVQRVLEAQRNRDTGPKNSRLDGRGR